MKKGFTLIEILAAIVILGIIGLIAFPTVNSIINNNKEKLYQSQLEEIKLSAEKWAYQNMKILPTDENSTITLTIAELKKAGLLQLDFRNPKTGELFPNDMALIITFKNNKYVYTIDENSGTSIDEFDFDGPTIILNGKNVVYVQIGDEYEELGINVIKSTGETQENIMYQYNGKEISEIDTSHLRTYTITYYVSDDLGTSKTIRTVIIVDSVGPQIIVSNINLNNPLEGVRAIDNSGENITVEIKEFSMTSDKATIIYSACDSSLNCSEVKRVVKIDE